MIRALGFILAAGAAFGQTAMTFEAASVKPADPDRHETDFRIYPGARLRVTNLSLSDLVRAAYNIKYYQVTGGPAWLNVDRFDIEAKAEGDPTRAQMMAMLQTLLADRFRLQAHRQSQEGNMYALVVAKGGHKLQPPTGEKSLVRLFRHDPADQPGVHYTIAGSKASLALIAERLGDMGLSRPVVDRTGIQGEFDFKVDFAKDDNPESGPSIFSAIQEQLGLKLEATKGPIETLVIVHAEKPSGN